MFEHYDDDAAEHDAAASAHDAAQQLATEWQLTSAEVEDLGGGIDPWSVDTHPTGSGSTNPEPTDPAPEVTVPGPAGTEFTGPATYDANGDGVPDTVVVRSQDGSVTSATDSDGDGVADHITVASADGQVTVSQQDDGGGSWHVVAIGTVNADGSISLNGDSTASVPAPSVDQSATPSRHPSTTDTTDSAATISVDHGDGWQVAAAGHIAADGDFVPAQHGAAPDIELTEPDGTAVDLGAPDQDMDGDGVAESVAVHTQDGHLLIVSDSDGDGTADHVIDINSATGAARWITITGGEWTEVEHGHVADDGSLVVDGTGENGPHGMISWEQLTVTVNGRSFPAGPATIDSDGDGVPDTVAVPGVGGSTQFYEDSNGDGVADRAWTVNADGSRGEVYAIDKQGHWVQQTGSAGSSRHFGAGWLSQYETGG